MKQSTPIPGFIFRVCLITLAIFCIQPDVQSQSTGKLVALHIHSKILGRYVPVTYYYPTIETDNKPLPVVYLLHGLNGQGMDWISNAGVNRVYDSLHKIGQIPDALLVMPDAGNSYYVNNYDGSLRYEDFFIQELIPYTDSVFQTQATKEHRYIAGLSMGGFGAVLLGIRHPELFCSVAGMSSAVRTDGIFKDLGNAEYNEKFGRVFGPNLHSNARITEHFLLNSPYSLIKNTNTAVLKNMDWYFECGSEDYLLSSNLAFDSLFNSYQIPHVMVIRPGAHNWIFWDAGIRHILIKFGETMKPKEEDDR